MSDHLNRDIASWKDVLVRLRRIEATWRGVKLSSRDYATWTEAILLCGMMLSDLSNLYPGCGTYRDHVLWCINATNTDVSEVASFLPDVIYLLRHYRGEEDSMTLVDFKRRLAKNHPKSGMLLAPVLGAINNFLTNPTSDSLRAPYQFFSFLTHLSLVDIDMSEELEAKFLENEERVHSHHLPDFIVARLRAIMQEWLRGFDVEVDTFAPHHGPGGVAEFSGDRSIASKYSVVKPDWLLTNIFEKRASIDLSTYLPKNDAAVTKRCSHIVFVPKSMKTKRVISKEPATLMFFQQGLARQLDKYFRRHPELSSHIDLHDQVKQGRKARSASATQQYATVDLSSASDSVSWELVKRIFVGTRLFPYLAALRSRTVRLPSGREFPVAKFAPMGSALCFPIQTLVFACIAEYTVRYVYQTTGYHNPRYWVYGDDIIVPDPCLTDLESNLRLLGFSLNRDKTFGAPYRFRESCGVDAYDGADVTPMKIGRRFVSCKMHVRSAGVFQGLIDMANHAYTYQFATLRRYLIDKLINETGWVPAFSDTGVHGLRSDTVSNYRLLIRWNVGYQRLEYYAAAPSTFTARLGPIKWDSKHRRYVEGEALEGAQEYALLEWLRLARNRSGDPLADSFPVFVHVGSVGTYLAKHWVVKP